MRFKERRLSERGSPAVLVSVESTEFTESIDEAECTGDDGTCKELRMCLFTTGLLLNDRRKSGCVASSEEHASVDKVWNAGEESERTRFEIGSGGLRRELLLLARLDFNLHASKGAHSDNGQPLLERKYLAEFVQQLRCAQSLFGILAKHSNRQQH